MPLARPRTTQVVFAVVHVLPPGAAVTVYLTAAPTTGAAQRTAALRSPGVVRTSVGTAVDVA